MRVVHVVRQFAPSVGGLEGAVLKLCTTLRGTGIEASVLTLNRVKQGDGGMLAATDSVEDVPVTRVPFQGSWRYPIAPTVLGHLRNVDVVHVHAIDFFFDFLACTKAVHRRPLVASTHGGFFHTEFARRLKHLYFQTITRASASLYASICASSRSDLALFKTIAPKNVTLVENGVDVLKWRNRASIRPVRALIAIGRFSSNKQLPKLLLALQSLRRLHPDWSLVIAGSAADLTANDVTQHARDAGLSDAVSVLAAPSDADIAAAIGASSYIVSASSYEGFGIGIVEGLSAGLTPILNRIPAFEALTADTGCGVLVDFEHPLATAAAIENAHCATLAHQAGLRSRSIDAAARYSWARAATLFTERYLAASESGL